jgi:hypothetical protein
MNRAIRTAVLATPLLAAMMVCSPAMAAKFTVIELSFTSRFDKPIVLHFAPPAGFSMKACKASLASAVAEFSPNLKKAFKKNYGSEIDRWTGAKFVSGQCATFDFPPSQLFKLKLSGQ